MKKNLVHVTLSMGSGGIEHLILNLCRRSDRERFNLFVICLDEAGELLPELEAMGVACRVEQRSPGLDRALIGRLAALFRSLRIDVVHSHNQAAAFYAGSAAFLARVPVNIATEHSRNYIDGNWKRRLEKKGLSLLLDRWITVSEQLARCSTHTDRLFAGKVEVILNGVDCDAALAPDRALTERIRESCRLGETTRNIVMVARLEPIKNHLMMLEALSLLLPSVDARLILVGEGSSRPALEKRAGELGIAEKVLFLGLRREIPELLALADAFVLCSHSEGLPLSLLEAAAAGVPLVVTRSSNGAGFVRDGETGTVVGDDAEALAAGVQSTLAARERASGMACAAQREVRERHSLAATARSYQALYLRLLQNKGRGGA